MDITFEMGLELVGHLLPSCTIRFIPFWLSELSSSLKFEPPMRKILKLRLAFFWPGRVESGRLPRYRKRTAIRVTSQQQGVCDEEIESNDTDNVRWCLKFELRYDK